MKELSLHILDIINNSVRAQATLIELKITEEPEKNEYSVRITDNGTGMSEENIKKVTDPWFTTRTTRNVGMGIPLFKQTAEQSGGFLKIDSIRGESEISGTTVDATFEHNNIDRPVLGDIEGTMAFSVSSNPEIEFNYKHKTSKGEYVFETKEVKEVLDGIPLTNPEVLNGLKEMIRENLKDIGAAV